MILIVVCCHGIMPISDPGLAPTSSSAPASSHYNGYKMQCSTSVRQSQKPFNSARQCMQRALRGHMQQE
jgi:hypothetical protein